MKENGIKKLRLVITVMKIHNCNVNAWKAPISHIILSMLFEACQACTKFKTQNFKNLVIVKINK